MKYWLEIIFTWWMSMRMTPASRHRERGRREKALEWVRSWSPKAQYTAAADGRVSVNTYRVATRYMYLNFWGFHIACIISLQTQIQNQIIQLHSTERRRRRCQLTKLTQWQHGHRMCKGCWWRRWNTKPTQLGPNVLHPRPTRKSSKHKF